MVAKEVTALFVKILDKLIEVESDLERLRLSGWPQVNSGLEDSGEGMEQAKRAAGKFAAKAVEVARDALILCAALDRTGISIRAGRKKNGRLRKE